MITPSDPQSSIVKDKSDLEERFHKTRQMSLELCHPLEKEDYVVQPAQDVSPPKWHLGHTTWFFEALVLKEFSHGYTEFHPDFSFMFNSYYESVGERVLRPSRGFMSRPSVDEVFAYREYVDLELTTFLAQNSSLDPAISDIIEIGIHHEQQHQELLVTDIKYILGNNPLFPVYQEGSLETTTPDLTPARYQEVEEGIYPIGHQGSGFCYDNEQGHHRVFLPSFSYMDRLVTNREYLEFILDGGYRDFRHWLSDGWSWVNDNAIVAPQYWHLKDGAWYQYTLNGFQEVQGSQPVTHVSFYEADAYARWMGKRLLTEFEWEIACRQAEPAIPELANFVDEKVFHPAPLRSNNQFYGDVWEWTNSAYLPYPHFEIREGALGEYNGKFMINQMVLRGGSCATSRDHIRPTYRNFFHPNLRWQFTGIRLATYR